MNILNAEPSSLRIVSTSAPVAGSHPPTLNHAHTQNRLQSVRPQHLTARSTRSLSSLRAERGVSCATAIARGTFGRMEPVGFDWNDRQAATNFAKHGVSFEEAMSVFDDRRGAIRDDPDHSIAEHREVIVGRSNTDRLLLVSFTERGDVIRLISARLATKREKKLYEETKH
jgi:uncharacterized DUF497 family protein